MDPKDDLHYELLGLTPKDEFKKGKSIKSYKGFSLKPKATFPIKGATIYIDFPQIPKSLKKNPNSNYSSMPVLCILHHHVLSLSSFFAF